MEAIEINGPVTIHDVRVEAGDFVVADDSGICFIPPHLVEPILAEAQRTEAAEDMMAMPMASPARPYRLMG
jgi:regulator of RNase E activity RraA